MVTWFNKEVLTTKGRPHGVALLSGRLELGPAVDVLAAGIELSFITERWVTIELGGREAAQDSHSNVKRLGLRRHLNVGRGR
jgi:hypothetical protein